MASRSSCPDLSAMVNDVDVTPSPHACSPKVSRVRRTLQFFPWLLDEVSSRPDSEHQKVPESHLYEVLKVPKRLEKLLCIGFGLCMDILLHELSFTPLQVILALPRIMNPARAARALSVTEQGDVIRLTLLLLNVGLITLFFDVSKVYHYIRGESFLKLYVIFNMLEMFERWWRSLGVDLFDWVMASLHQPWWSWTETSLGLKYVAMLGYCFLHSTMHYTRVLLLNVAINTSSNQIFMIIITNNFGEIKSTVFKRYAESALFPIVASDIVERFYLLCDIMFVLTRLSISPQTGSYSNWEMWSWFCWLVCLEILTDWVKFALIAKFSELKAETLEIYRDVLIADVLMCRYPSVGTGVLSKCLGDASKVSLPYRGIHSFSHVPARRIGFSGVPLTTLVVIHIALLWRSRCSERPRLTTVLFIGVAFALCILAKVLWGVLLFGFAARRRNTLKRGLTLFPKIRAL